MSNASSGPAPVDDDRAAVGAHETAIGLEREEVLADRDGRDAELDRQLGDPGAAMLLDDPGDVLLSFAGEDVARRVGAGTRGHGRLPAAAGFGEGSEGFRLRHTNGTVIAMSRTLLKSFETCGNLSAEPARWTLERPSGFRIRRADRPARRRIIVVQLLRATMSAPSARSVPQAERIGEPVRHAIHSPAGYGGVR